MSQQEFTDHSAEGRHHVEEAESWLALAPMPAGEVKPGPEQCYAEAQVHATLALAQYTAELAEQQRVANILAAGITLRDDGTAVALVRRIGL